MKITVWNQVDDKGTVYFNYIENGWADGEYPKPKKNEYINQKAWENLKWIKKYAHLVNDVVCYV
jgi:hypothetical protein